MTNTIDINATYTPDDEPADLQPEMVLAGKYRLIKQIGKGAMGVVWQAHDGNRQVALKFVPKECSRFTDEMERMRQSFNKIHALNHQSICPTYDLVNDGDFGYFLVMKFLEGETLDDYRLRKDPKHNGLPLDQVLELIKPVAQALDYAHRNDVIHRDIKPSNIFLSETAKGINVEIIDFGLADEVREGMSRVSKVTFDMSGTPAYMAPEQWKGARQTAATDQYALAVIVYELLAGHLPFSGSNIENAVLKYDPEPIREMPEKANAALLKALAKQGADRFAACQDFMDALAGVEIVTKAGDGAQRSPGTSEQATVSSPPITQSSAPSEVISLMKRARLFLEDSDWQQATQYFNRVLDVEPEYAPAYVGLLCAELQVQREELLGDYKEPIAENKHFQKAVRFANSEYKAILEGYDEKIRERIRQEQYDRLVQSKNGATENEFRELVHKFRKMNGYKDTAELANECNEQHRFLKEQREEQKRQEQYDQLVQEMNIASSENAYQYLVRDFRRMNGYKDTAKLADECDARYRVLKEQREEQQRQEHYDRLVQSKNGATENEFRELVHKFREMNGYKDTAELANECDAQYRVLKERREEEKRIERECKQQEKYERLVQWKNKDSEYGWEYPTIAEQLRTMNGYKDTAELANECDKRYHELKKCREEKEHQERKSREKQEEQRKHKPEEQYKRWEQQGLCRHCGGQMGGFFTKKCKSCGKTKE